MDKQYAKLGDDAEGVETTFDHLLPQCGALLSSAIRVSTLGHWTMRPTFLALLTAAAVLTTPSHADSETSPLTTGNGFLDFCRNDSNRLLCTGFMNGFHTGAMNASLVISMREAGTYEEYKKKYKPYCAPDAANAEQLLDIALEHMKNNPQDRHNQTGLLIIVALRRAFPCSSSQ